MPCLFDRLAGTETPSDLPAVLLSKPEVNALLMALSFFRMTFNGLTLSSHRLSLLSHSSVVGHLDAPPSQSFMLLIEIILRDAASL